MMNEFDEATLASLVRQHGMGDVLLALARICNTQHKAAHDQLAALQWEHAAISITETAALIGSE